MKLALHRSLTFWSGILVMAFLCWGWWDSMTYQSSYALSHHSGYSSRGECSVFFSSTATPYGGERREWDVIPSFRIEAFPRPAFARGGARGVAQLKAELDERDQLKTYRDLMVFEMRYYPREDWFLSIPHWLLFLAVALPWTAALLWRARRRKRAATIA